MSSLHKLLCSVICALTLATAGPTPARAAATTAAVCVAPLADSWSWREFWKFWVRQFGRTSGVIGFVLLVGVGAIMLILVKTRR